jgi:hypothetical protein
MFDLKCAMRELCPQAVEVVKRCLASDDERVALAACEIAFERGFGKAELHADVSIQHNFVVAPQTMELGEWLERKGQVGPSRWLERQQARDANVRARAPRAQPPIELTANAEAVASTSAQAGNGNEAAPAEHLPVERNKLN